MAELRIIPDQVGGQGRQARTAVIADEVVALRGNGPGIVVTIGARSGRVAGKDSMSETECAGVVDATAGVCPILRQCAVDDGEFAGVVDPAAVRRLVWLCPGATSVQSCHGARVQRAVINGDLVDQAVQIPSVPDSRVSDANVDARARLVDRSQHRCP